MASLAPAAPHPAENSLGFLRFFLAALVVYDHANYLGNFHTEAFSRASRGQVTSGQFAVEAFFILSGFLVTQSFQRLRKIGRYAWHRLLRLAPAFWVCLLVTALALPAIVPRSPDGPPPLYFGPGGACAYLARNFLFPSARPAIAGVFTHNLVSDYVNGSLWTLPYEIAFYCLVAACGLLGFFRRPWSVWLLTGLAWAALVTSWLPEHDFPAVITGGRGLFSSEGKRLGLYYLMGMSWALLPSPARQRATRLLPQALLWLGLAVGTAAGYYQVMAPLLLPPLLLGLSRQLPLARWEHWVGGDYSYGLYIYGYPVLQVLVAFGCWRLGLAPLVSLGLALTATLAVLSWHLIEKPALAWKNAPLFRARPATSQR